MFYDFIALDFETASSAAYSACSLGLVFVKNSRVIDKKYYLIKPPCDFSPYNVKVHGIKAKDVADQPDFKTLWAEIHPLLKHTLLVAHSAKFDVGVLTACCNYYGLPLPYFQYVDSIDLFRSAYPTHQKGSLDYCARLLNIELVNHHNAMEDAVACAEIAIKSIKRIQKLPLPQMIAAFKNIKIKTSDIIFTMPNLDPDHPLYDQTIAFSGEILESKGNLKIEYKTEVVAPLPPMSAKKKGNT